MSTWGSFQARLAAANVVGVATSVAGMVIDLVLAPSELAFAWLGILIVISVIAGVAVGVACTLGWYLGGAVDAAIPGLRTEAISRAYRVVGSGTVGLLVAVGIAFLSPVGSGIARVIGAILASVLLWVLASRRVQA